MTDDLPRIRVGQIWREVDNRFDRYVEVEGISGPTALVRTVILDDSCNWTKAPNSRAGWSKLSRFNGKSGGYELFEELPS